MKIHIAENWSHLQDIVFEESWNTRLKRYRSPCAFRGMGDASFLLENTLMRLAGIDVKIEQHLLRNFKKYAHKNLIASDSLWHWLALAQHHGLPTRLLDWTYSPLIAMHFATSKIEDFDKDGVIWSINYEKAHSILPSNFRDALYGEGANMFTADILSKVIKNLKDFDNLDGQPLLLMFEPSSMNDRIINQYAVFSVMSNSNTTVDSWAEKHDDNCKKIIVPAKLKWELRDKLDQSNITERVLFPGLDGLAHWLKRHYSVKQR